MTEPLPPVADRAEVFAHVVAGVRAGGLPVPVQVTFEPELFAHPYLCLLVEAGDLIGVDRWAAHFGLRGAALAPYLLELPDVPAWRMYEAESDGPLVERPGPDGSLVRERDYLAAPLLWNGWNVHIACRVDAAMPVVLALDCAERAELAAAVAAACPMAPAAVDDTAPVDVVCEAGVPPILRTGPYIAPLLA